jgi:MarR family transcriptional regulator, transcriptional regulator for hemolysin
MEHPPAPIGLYVTRSARAIGKAFDEALATQGGSLPSWLVLAACAGGLRDSQRTIAADLGIEGATLTHHLARMENDGLVHRERDPEDRRAVRVELTDKGRDRFSSLLTTVLAFDQQLRDGFTEAELATLRDLLGRLADNVRANDPSGRKKAEELATAADGAVR